MSIFSYLCFSAPSASQVLIHQQKAVCSLLRFLTFKHFPDSIMSKYENYSEVAKSYDKDRNAFGADIIAGILQVHGSKQLKVVHLLPTSNSNMQQQEINGG